MNPPLKIRSFSEYRFASSIKEFCNQGNLKEAFHLLGDFFSDHNSIFPEENYAPILDLCASRKALFQGQQIHAHVIKSRLVSDPDFLNTKLVFMYGKCGSVLDAEKVFDRISERTNFAWNGMMGAYVLNGKALRALDVFREMVVSDAFLDAVTFVSALKACGMLKNRRVGAEIHCMAVKTGYDSAGFIVNSLVAMFAKCNDVVGARKLFDCMDEKDDPVLWNSILSAYSANGQSSEALKLFKEMLVASISINSYTYVAALQACGDSPFQKLGEEIHAFILKSDPYPDVYVANALIAMYVRSGKMTEAVETFDQIYDKDDVSWNSLLTGFVQNGLYMEAVQFFHESQEAGIKADEVSVSTILAASGRLNNLLNGMEMHAYAVKNGYDSNLLIANTLIDMYAKCRCENYMARVFHKIPNKDFIPYATIIAGYSQNNSPVKAIELFREFLREQMCTDSLMIGSILRACTSSKMAKEIHGHLIRRDFSNRMLQNTLVDVYGKCGDIDYATRIFKCIEDKDVVSWTSIISLCVENELPDEAVELFHSMRDDNIEPDSIAIACILSASANLSGLNKGKEIHCFIVRNHYPLEGSIANSLIDMYGRCGNLENARKLFDCVGKKSLLLWTSMINSYGMHGHGKSAIDLFYRMLDENITPDHITFLALLKAFSHSGLIDEGKFFFESMRNEYQLEPWQEHYACVVDLLGRANQLEEAYSFVKSMETEPIVEVWCALLNACQVHSNKEIGEFAAQKLLELGSDNPGNFVLISNVFAASSRWKDVEHVRTRMRTSGLKKNPGCSWIEIGNKIHSFIARDKSHPESDDIYRKLAEITDKLEKEGSYVPQTQLVLHDVEEDEKVEILKGHSERLAIAYGLLKTCKGIRIRITKNLRVCGDCHSFCKLVSRLYKRELIIRDANRFHHFKDGVCSCRDFW
ncbi:LOW QUALITY PROTEIN: pentatricopeptide repeat-containing protein At3g63370, chloroplastic [Rutidosis leptorrhynchoides]|uniref:LOW QUALITY PROTEIN: pentatricopeptide repeat-containing protein At3g63370, chloroplastic n=1 Tax=Rutidosis leptorrhynchoides TaxID=125765 RepID=UPI003A9939DC